MSPALVDRTIPTPRIELLDRAVVAVLRSKAPRERVAMGFACQRTARLILAAHLRQRHADWDDGQIQAEIARRMSLGAG
jgi:hypothetical protein